MTDVMINDHIVSGRMSIRECGDMLGQYMGANPSVVLAGAGVSCEAPSCLPLGDQLKLEVYETACPSALSDNSVRDRFLQYLKEVRPEAALELVSVFALDAVIAYLEPFIGNEPNTNHHALVRLLEEKAIHAIITTNIDLMFEQALKQLPSDMNGISILNPSAVTPAVEYPLLLKVHGSANERWEKHGPSAFALSVQQTIGVLSENMKHSLGPLLAHHSLFVLGYSGRDDFDLNPFFRTLKSDGDLIWIVHSSEAKDASVYAEEGSDLSRSRSLCRDISSAYPRKRYFITANTAKLLNAIAPSKPAKTSRKSRCLKRRTTYIPASHAEQHLLLGRTFGYHHLYAKEAITQLQYALEAQPDPATTVGIQITLAIHLAETSNELPLAEDLLQMASATARSINDAKLVSIAEMELSLLYGKDYSTFDKAFSHIRESISYAYISGDVHQQGLAHSNLANLLYYAIILKEEQSGTRCNKSEFAESRSEYESACKLLKEANALPNYCGSLDGLGWAALRMGDSKGALDCWIQELTYKAPLHGCEEANVVSLSTRIATLLWACGQGIRCSDQTLELIGHYKCLRVYWVLWLLKAIKHDGKLVIERQKAVSARPHLTVNQFIDTRSLRYFGATKHPPLGIFDMTDVTLSDISECLFSYTVLLASTIPHDGLTLFALLPDGFPRSIPPSFTIPVMFEMGDGHSIPILLSLYAEHMCNHLSKTINIIGRLARHANWRVRDLAVILCCLHEDLQLQLIGLEEDENETVKTTAGHAIALMREAG